MVKYNKANEIKTAVVGYGAAFNMGRHHLTDMKRAGMIPTAVAELDRQRLEVAKEDFPGIETYTSVRAMLEQSDVDLVTLITPHNTHAKLALQCLASGRHVICEKPMAITTSQCDAMIKEAAKRKLLVSTFHNRHWDGCVMQALKRVKGGAIGSIHRVHARLGHYGRPGKEWRNSKSISGGIMYDWGVHVLEYALQIIDDDIVEVSGFAHRGYWQSQTVWKSDTNEDEATAVVRFKNGVWLTITVSQLDVHHHPFWLEFNGTKGSYSFAHDKWQTVILRSGKTIVTQGPNPLSQWHRYYQNIANHLVKREPLVITGEWARRPIHIIDLAGRSARQGKTLNAKYK